MSSRLKNYIPLDLRKSLKAQCHLTVKSRCGVQMILSNKEENAQKILVYKFFWVLTKFWSKTFGSKKYLDANKIWVWGSRKHFRSENVLGLKQFWTIFLGPWHPFPLEIFLQFGTFLIWNASPEEKEDSKVVKQKRFDNVFLIITRK